MLSVMTCAHRDKSFNGEFTAFLIAMIWHSEKKKQLQGGRVDCGSQFDSTVHYRKEHVETAVTQVQGLSAGTPYLNSGQPESENR